MIKIFSSNQTFYLTETEPALKTSNNAVFVNINSADEIQNKYNDVMNNRTLTDIYFVNKNLQVLFNHFSSLFTIIDAAGGLVKNDKKEWLFIFRNGKWDLPKGKVEKHESIKNAAIREVEEECGVSKLTIVKELSPTYHIYNINEKVVLKRSYWFEMFCDDNSKLIPQTEEGITDAKWLQERELVNVLSNTYPSIKEVMQNI